MRIGFVLFAGVITNFLIEHSLLRGLIFNFPAGEINILLIAVISYALITKIWEWGI